MYWQLEWASKPSGTSCVYVTATGENDTTNVRQKKYRPWHPQPAHICPITYQVQTPQRAGHYVPASGTHGGQSRGPSQVQYTWNRVSARHQISIIECLLCTPALYNAGEQTLLWIVCNVWAEPIDNLPKMVIWKLHNLGGCHAWFEWSKYLGKWRVQKLTTKFSKVAIIAILTIS